MKVLLTSTDLGDHSLCEGSVLCQLLSKALTHVIINIIGTQQLFKGLHGEKFTHNLIKMWPSIGAT